MEKDKKPFIVFATPVLLQGGTEYQMLSTLKALSSQGYRLAVLCYYEYDNSIVQIFNNSGIEVFLLGLVRENKSGMQSHLRLFFSLVAWFRRNRPDIVNIQYLAPGLIPVIASRLSCLKRILTTIHIAGSVAYGKRAKLLFRISTKLAHHIICVSQGTEKFWFGTAGLYSELTNLRNRKHFTIYNSIDFDHINNLAKSISSDEVRAQYKLPSEKIILGIFGRLAAQKGHKILFESMVLLKKDFSDFLLLVVGAGPMENELRRDAERLGLESYIVFLGAKPQRELFRLYKALDLLIIPSLYEGFGLVALEAMALSIPVIASRIEGLSEIVDEPNTGFLVEPGNAKELAFTISKAIQSPDQLKRLGHNGELRAERVFSFDRFSELTTIFYSSLINGKND